MYHHPVTPLLWMILLPKKEMKHLLAKLYQTKIKQKLKEILSLLQMDVQDQVRDADLLREALEFIDQDLPADIKASLEPVSQLDNHFAAVKQALKNLSSQPALEQRRATTKKP
jgi:ferritin